MIALPTIAKLIQRTRALAALDLIMSPPWEYRYYSFNSHWSPDEQMGSMRNGSGDEWWIVFHEGGWAALKGLDHESLAWSKGEKELALALQAALPAELKSFAIEPAFRWDETSFAYYCLSDAAGWKRANDKTRFSDIATGEEGLLHILQGTEQEYVEFADEYYEKTIPKQAVAAIYGLSPLTQKLVSDLNPEVSLDDISAELYEEIGYPTAQ